MQDGSHQMMNIVIAMMLSLGHVVLVDSFYHFGYSEPIACWVHNQDESELSLFWLNAWVYPVTVLLVVEYYNIKRAAKGLVSLVIGAFPAKIKHVLVILIVSMVL